jgi:biotin-dependent carboxylase-like uncharacterized protein
MRTEKGSALILRTGPGSSIQDQGRFHGSQFGIPSSGVMDQKSFFWVNHILQNSPNDAVLEISSPGFTIQFDFPALVSIAGAKSQVMVNSKEEANPSLIAIQAGDILEIGRFSLGCRTYLGIKGGFQSPLFLESRSFFGPVTSQSMLRKGDLLEFQAINFSSIAPVKAKPRWNPAWIEGVELEAFPGPDWALLSPNQQEKITKTEFHLSKLSNRMGIQLEELVENTLPEMPTNPVFPGTIQLTSGGKLLILMRDAGVTGGYPRILQLPEESISLLSQKNPGQAIRFLVKDF